MRKTFLMLIGAALVAATPSIASAKWRKAYRPMPVAPVADNAGPHFVAESLHQLIVPLEVTFAPRPAPRPVWRRRHG